MTQTNPIILCDKCYKGLGYTETLTMGKAGREKCDLCGSILHEEYNWVWGIENVKKNREEQEEDFKILAAYASPNCKYCLGTGKEHWIVELSQYKPCGCVLKNVTIMRQRGTN